MNLMMAIIGIILLAVGIVLLVTARKGRAANNRIAGVALIVVAVGAVGYSCMVSIPAGHTGVVTTFGKVEDYTFEAGLHYIMPWQEVVKMDNRVQRATLDMSCFSSDIQEVTLSYTVNYQINKTNAQTIYRSIGESYYNVVIEPCISESVKVVTALYTAESLIADRSQMAEEIETALAEKLAVYNIELVGTSIENMDFTDAFEAAVEEKQVAEQNRLKAATQAQQKVIEAKAAAEVKEIEADAYAYETTTRAEAESAANKKIAESLTDTLIDYTYASKWNGQTPYVSGGTSIVDMGDVVTGSKTPATTPTTEQP